MRSYASEYDRDTGADALTTTTAVSLTDVQRFAAWLHGQDEVDRRRFGQQDWM